MRFGLVWLVLYERDFEYSIHYRFYIKSIFYTMNHLCDTASQPNVISRVNTHSISHTNTIPATNQNPQKGRIHNIAAIKSPTAARTARASLTPAAPVKLTGTAVVGFTGEPLVLDDGSTAPIA